MKKLQVSLSTVMLRKSIHMQMSL